MNSPRSACASPSSTPLQKANLVLGVPRQDFLHKLLGIPALPGCKLSQFNLCLGLEMNFHRFQRTGVREAMSTRDGGRPPPPLAAYGNLPYN